MQIVGFLVQRLISSFPACAAVLPDDSEDSLDGYTADDNLRDAIMAVLAGDADKRGFRCRPGFTYQSVLRQCVPSLGVRGFYFSENNHVQMVNFDQLP